MMVTHVKSLCTSGESRFSSMCFSIEYSRLTSSADHLHCTLQVFREGFLGTEDK